MTTNTPSFLPLTRMCSVLAVSAIAFGLAACNKAQEPPTVGQKLDSAVQKADQAAEDAKAKAEQALSSAGNKVESAANQAGDAMKEAAQSAATLTDDAAITAKISAALAKDPDLSAIKIDVDTKDGAVRLSGPAPSQAAKDRAGSLAQAVEGVHSVNNELVVGKS